MSEEIDTHIAAVEAAYRPLVTGPACRLTGGARLWSQYEQAVCAYHRHGRAQVMGMIERVNELAVAKQLLADGSLAGAEILYEPEIVTGGTRFDFVVPEAGGKALYIEAKTVEPRTEDTDRNWQTVERRQEHVTLSNHYIVDKDWMGATIFGNSFKARSSFFNYTLETEAKLKDHIAVRPGRAVLVFCGTGFAWHVSELEDFADFYRTGRHRNDDPFAAMERHAMEHGGPEPARTLDGFSVLMRKHDEVDAGKWVYPVRGPSWG